MAVLEEVSQMRKRGMPEEDIVKTLQDKGIAPKSINDALNQTRIKQAVEGEESGYNEYENLPQYPTSKNNVKSQEIYEDEETYTLPGPQDTYASQPQDEYVPQPQENYNTYQGYQNEEYTGFDTNTIIEISEQVFFEKTEKLQNQIDQFTEFMELEKARMENISRRLNRIEMIIDKLQTTILEKVGSYGENLEEIKNEMSMMQDSFSKMVNPILKASERNSTHNSSKETKTNMKKSSKK